MRGGLDAALIRVREYQRWIGYRRAAARMSASLDERDRADPGPRAADLPPGADRPQGASSAPARRSLVSMGAAITLLLVAVTAICLGVSALGNRAPQPGAPYAAVKPTESARGSASSS